VIPREKWTLFDEATHVPLIIYHPTTPPQTRGSHYAQPVELVDVYPTLLELMQLPGPESEPCFLPESPRRCIALDGRSLAHIVLGASTNEPAAHTTSTTSQNQLKPTQPPSPRHEKLFAVTQVTRCADRSTYSLAQALPLGSAARVQSESRMWHTCLDEKEASDDIVALLGYSLRTNAFRYTAYFRFDLTPRDVILVSSRGAIAGGEKNDVLYRRAENVVFQELYDHRADATTPLVERETINVADVLEYASVVEEMYLMVIDFIVSTRRPGLRRIPKRGRKKRKQILATSSIRQKAFG
jgi:hypothetical protein